MAAFPQQLTSDWKNSVRRRLLKWYRQHARPLPWRTSTDPYRIWISEVMLQQTTIAAVRPRFEQFQKRFPTLVDLAGAPEADVLRQWEGLGYYSRARNLHRAARMVVDKFAGVVPDKIDELLMLPGVGRYTARAIASMAFGHGVGILEANTIRLYSRLIALEENPRSTFGNRLLWDFADWIVAPRRPSCFNQAAMDVGSTICLPVQPACNRCPVQHQCQSFKAGRQHELPQTVPKRRITNITEVALILRRGQKVLMRQCSKGERWAGLWDFTRFPISIEEGDRLLELPRPDTITQPLLFASEAIQLVLDAAKKHTGLHISDPVLLQQIHHTVTHHRIRLLCVMSSRVKGSVNQITGLRWQPVVCLNDLPLSTTARTIASRITFKDLRSNSSDREQQAGDRTI